MRHPAYGELRPVTSYASVLLAHNPTPMTLDGTNTWVLRAPGATGCAILDPGPADDAHLRKAADQGPVSLILLSHHHLDHSAAAREFAERTGAPVRALDPALCIEGDPLRDGEEIDAAGVPLRVLATPGHTEDSVCFLVGDGAEPAMFTGDSILGRGTTVVAHPDGHLGSYLDSLRSLAALPEGVPGLPGHGPELPDVAATATSYLAHRNQRLDQVRAVVLDHGPTVTARDVVEIVYADVARDLWAAAEWTVQAQLSYLRELGEL